MARFTFFLIILTIAGCSRPKSFGEAEKSQVAAEVKEMLNEYLKAMSEEGLMSEFKYLDNSASFFWVPPGFNSALSYDSVRAIILRNAKAVRFIQYHYDTLIVNPLSFEIASYSAIVSGKMVDTAGINIPVRLIESGITIKREDGWKLLSGQSAVLPLNQN